jgi:hypothetical protein
MLLSLSLSLSSYYDVRVNGDGGYSIENLHVIVIVAAASMEARRRLLVMLVLDRIVRCYLRWCRCRCRHHRHHCGREKQQAATGSVEGWLTTSMLSLISGS